MTVLTIHSTTLYAHTAGRVVRESVAIAMLANLITVRVRAE